MVAIVRPQYTVRKRALVIVTRRKDKNRKRVIARFSEPGRFGSNGLTAGAHTNTNACGRTRVRIYSWKLSDLS